MPEIGVADGESAAIRADHEEPAGLTPTTRRGRPTQLYMLAWRLVILAVFLSAWEYIPRIGGASSSIPLLNPVFISSPSKIAVTLFNLAFARAGEPLVWPYLEETILAAVLGSVLGLLLGALFGLLLSNYPTMSDVIQPFVVAANSIPRIALIPIVILVAGPGRAAAVINAVLVVFFIGFFNAFEGGRSVPRAVWENAVLLGAGPIQLMWRIRREYAVIWTFAAIPNAVSFGLIAAVTSEILTGSEGMGFLITQSITNIDASLGFAVIVLLSAVGIVLTIGSERLRWRLMRWRQYEV